MIAPMNGRCQAPVGRERLAAASLYIWPLTWKDVPMRLVEGVGSAVFVAAVVALIAWRVHADVVLVPAVAGLLTFLAVVLRTRSPGRALVRRRSPARRRSD